MEIIFHSRAKKLMFTRKVVHLERHFESEGFWNSEVAYLSDVVGCGVGGHLNPHSVISSLGKLHHYL